jgi:1,4-dihydroxy-2-naphthoate octaprenyltransferase
LAVLAGVYLTWIAGWPVIVIGLASLLAGAAYTAGPLPLAYNGLGDLFVMIFFGFVAVVGTVFVVSGQVPQAAWWVGAAVGALTVNILVVNNIRDIETDRRARRRNIPVVFGRKIAEWEYALMLGLAFTVPLLLLIRGLSSWPVLLVFLTLPQGVKLLNTLRSGLEGPPLNRVLGQTAQLLFWYSLLLAAGLFLSS